mmetsp:Transcript_69681/g.166326  ORF Transcript_69681/g.166326 Transcript_69681/m.166326 type:complete len:206 (+) Transcript_69681:771-1388(+)
MEYEEVVHGQQPFQDVAAAPLHTCYHTLTGKDEGVVAYAQQDPQPHQRQVGPQPGEGHALEHQAVQEHQRGADHREKDLVRGGPAHMLLQVNALSVRRVEERRELVLEHIEEPSRGFGHGFVLRERGRGIGRRRELGSSLGLQGDVGHILHALQVRVPLQKASLGHRSHLWCSCTRGQVECKACGSKGELQDGHGLLRNLCTSTG